MKYYIIEHPTRGTLKDDSEVQEPRWSPTNLRSDDRNMRYFSLGAAIQGLERYVPPKLIGACYIMRFNERGADAWTRIDPPTRNEVRR